MDRYFLCLQNVFDKKFYTFVETFYKDFDNVLNTFYFSGYEILRFPAASGVEVYAQNEKARKLIGIIRVNCDDECLQNGGDVD